MTNPRITDHITGPAPSSAKSSQLRQALAELHDARAELEAQRTWAQAMFNSLGEGLIAVDETGRIISVNPIAAKLLGYRVDELTGKWFTGTIRALDDQGREIEPLQRPLVRAVTSGEVVTETIHYIRRDDTTLPVKVTCSPIIQDGRPAGAIEVFHDLTEERRLEIAKDEFVSLASHQLRTPSTGVKSVLSLLKDEDFGPLTPLQHKYLGRAIEANNRQLQIIEDMLSVAKIDAGRMERVDRHVDLSAIVRESAMEQATTISMRNQRLRLNIPETCPFRGDEGKLRMAIDNLVSNASKYTPGGGEVRVSLEPSDRLAVIKIADNGLGIHSDDLPRLFKKFSRVPNKLSTTVGGNGLGLYLAKNIIELHGGSISVHSRLGEGTEFITILPVKSEVAI